MATKEEKLESFESNPFCTVCLEANDGQRQYASKDILYRHSNFFKTMLVECSDDEIIVPLDVSSSAISRFLAFIYFNRLTVSEKILTRGEICELIFLAHYLDSQPYLTILLQHYELNFSKYGPVEIQDLRKIPMIFNEYPAIRNLYIEQHLQDIADMKITKPDYKNMDKDLLVTIIEHRLFQNYDPTAEMTDRMRRKFIIVEDTDKNFCLAVVVSNNEDGSKLVHLCGKPKFLDKSISPSKIKSLQDNGKYFCFSCDSYHCNNPDFIFEHFLENLSFDDPQETLNDLRNLPRKYWELESYQKALRNAHYYIAN